MRSELVPAAAATFWYPIVGQPSDGVGVLRAIALARLVLPAEVEVQAPLAALGPKLAQVALEFGASHLGYAAPDGKKSDDPLVADPGALDELLQSISRTELMTDQP